MITGLIIGAGGTLVILVVGAVLGAALAAGGSKTDHSNSDEPSE